MFVLGDGNPLVHIRAAYINRSIIVLCVLAYVMQVSGGLEVLDYVFVPAGLAFWIDSSGWLDQTGTPARLIAYQFLHADALHLAGNMLMLWVFGDNIEDALGHLRYLLFYLICGVVAAVVFTVFVADPWVPLLGASGSISGVMGAYLLLHPRARVLVAVLSKVPLALPAALVVGLYILLNIAMAYSTTGMTANQLQGDAVAWWAHVGGFAAGLALIPVARRRGVALFQPLSAYPVDPFPRLRAFAGQFGLGGLFAGAHENSPDNGLAAALLRAVIFIAATGLMLGLI